MQLMTLAEVLHHMDTTADPFDVVFYSADRKRKTGGERVKLEGCVATRRASPAPAAPSPAERGAGGERKPSRHRANQTRNLTILSSQQVRTIHVRLITEFNGKKVRW